MNQITIQSETEKNAKLREIANIYELYGSQSKIPLWEQQNVAEIRKAIKRYENKNFVTYQSKV